MPWKARVRKLSQLELRVEREEATRGDKHADQRCKIMLVEFAGILRPNRKKHYAQEAKKR